MSSDSHIVANNSDIVFPPAARRAQAERSSARLYAKRIAEGFPDRISPEVAGLHRRASTPRSWRRVSAAGAPYIQHRGGPKGFIKVLDDRTLGFADYARQPAVHHHQQSCPQRPRLSVPARFRRAPADQDWGRARVVENDPAPARAPRGPRLSGARPERAILFTVEAWDVNCTQHITARFTESEIADATVVLRERMSAVLEAENARLRAHTVSSELRESEAAAPA